MHLWYQPLCAEARHTINTGAIRLHSDFRHLPILCHKCIPLTAVVAEKGGAVEGKIERRCECAVWVSEEADLRTWSIGISQYLDYQIEENRVGYQRHRPIGPRLTPICKQYR